ncbi:DUF7260 family protein [Haladaptatus caseinilyticus]|uniref:DUF7260 family protein n=1 Tax=Haladaptatus caseinilyticus TaxID=2993314 RepID=UPI00224AA56C|nr:hypothetical protein [Haladaptatus caseinilyticus]
MGQNGYQLVDYTSLPKAERLTSKEESQCKAEINAFQDFLDKFDEISPRPYQTDGGSVQKAVLMAYRDTILAVDHWADEYGEENVHESIKNEFGPEIATGLAGGSATWSHLLWDQLRTESEAAIKTRRRSLGVLSEERQQLQELRRSLSEIGDELAAVERCEYPFAERSDRLTTIQQQLDELTQERQTHLHQRKKTHDKLFSSYIYGCLETDFPGLAALATARQILDRIKLRHWAGLVRTRDSGTPNKYEVDFEEI